MQKINAKFDKINIFTLKDLGILPQKTGFFDPKDQAGQTHHY